MRQRYQKLYSVRMLEQVAEDAGSHWFERGALSFFRSRIGWDSAVCLPDGGILFLTSEQGPSDVRRYSVRRGTLAGEVSTVGDFNSYDTRAQAHRAMLAEAKRIAAEVAEG